MKNSIMQLFLACLCFSVQALAAQPKVKSEESLFLALQKTGIGSMNELEEKKKFIETVRLEKQKIQDKMLVNVYQNAFDYYRAGNYEDARDLSSKILSIDPGFEDASMLKEAAEQLRGSSRPGVTEKIMLEDRFKSALSLYNDGRILDAYKKMDEVVKLSPNNIKAKYWLGRMKNDLCDYYYQQGDQLYAKRDYKGALDNMYNALMIRPRDARIVEYIARVEDDLRRETANDKLRSALRDYAQGRLKEAYAGLKGVLEVQPGDSKAGKLLADVTSEIEQGYIARGRKLYGERKFTAAIAEWGEAKPYTSNLSYLDKLIARAREQMRLDADEKRRKAEEAARRAREESERMKREEEERRRAEEEAARLNRGGPMEGPVVKTTTEENRRTAMRHYEEGLKYYQNANYEKARDEWTIAKQLDPGNEDVEQGLRRLDQLRGD